MESEYIRRSLGQALVLGLAEVAAVRPADPVEYLALWLLQHKRNLSERDEVCATSDTMRYPQPNLAAG